MIRNYIITAYRNLWRNKTFAILNISGLALAIGAALLILLWVQDELRFDRFHSQGNRIYRVMAEFSYSTRSTEYGGQTAYPLADVLTSDFPEIESAVRVDYDDDILVMRGDHKYKENICFADPDFFKLFDFPLVQGDPDHVFGDLYSIVLTSSYAKRYFGDQDPVGQTVRIKSWYVDHDLVVTGIIKDPPTHSTIQFDLLAPIQLREQHIDWMKSWGTVSLETYLLMAPGATAASLESKIKNLPAKYHDWEYYLFLHPMEEMHLWSEFEEGRVPTGRISMLRIFSFIGIMILLIGCINFMNLATAYSAKRAKEIGVRKVLGAHRGRLVGQFLGEALIVAASASLLAIAWVQLLVPAFNSLTGKELVIPIAEPGFILSFIAIVLFVGITSGSYPALFISAFKPTAALKGKINLRSRFDWLRTGLVIFQLATSSVLIISTILIYQQVEFIQNKNLGLNRSHVLYFDMPYSNGVTRNPTAFESGMRAIPQVKHFAFSGQNPVSVNNNSGDPTWEGKDPNLRTTFYFIDCGFGFVETMGLKLLEGRDFSPAITTDTASFIINQAAAKVMGLESAVGTTMEFWDKRGKIIGVVEDFHHASFHSPIEPMILRFWPENASYVFVKVAGHDIPTALASIGKVYSKYEDEYPFSYTFLDSDFEQLYQSELVVQRLINSFALLAILISCLGLYGLVAFAAESRSKEIGIRKILGASVKVILALLSYGFLRWAIVANLIAFPVAWLILNRWLQGYAFRVSIELWVFFVAGGLTLIIVGLTLLLRGYKTATINPVESLRYE